MLDPDMVRRGFDGMRSPPASAMIALASATGQADTLPTSQTSAGRMVPCSMQFPMLPVLRSSDRASSMIFTTAPRSFVTCGFARSSDLGGE
jgi:hypothetical protein